MRKIDFLDESRNYRLRSRDGARHSSRSHNYIDSLNSQSENHRISHLTSFELLSIVKTNEIFIAIFVIRKCWKFSNPFRNWRRKWANFSRCNHSNVSNEVLWWQHKNASSELLLSPKRIKCSMWKSAHNVQFHPSRAVPFSIIETSNQATQHKSIKQEKWVWKEKKETAKKISETFSNIFHIALHGCRFDNVFNFHEQRTETKKCLTLSVQQK